ncbi:hypothetical protein P7C70_g6076, partial [Phenoliferia sp. Uapishka_3]
MQVPATIALLTFASSVITSPLALERRATFTYPTFSNPAAAGYRVTTSSLPLFNGIDVQDSWAGRVDPASTPGSGLFFWVSFIESINDGVYSDQVVGDQAPAARFAAANAASLGFNSSFLDELMTASNQCGYETLLDTVVYPPAPGVIPLPFATIELDTSRQLLQSWCVVTNILLDPCKRWLTVNFASSDVFSSYVEVATQMNSCFNIYRITDKCPNPTDLIQNGDYFNRPDVQAALHVGNSTTWRECSLNDPFVHSTDDSPFSETLLPAILAQISVLLWHGEIDGVLLSAGDLITIQNMTWGGVQGFTTAPNSTMTLNGVATGTWHTERNLTFLMVNNAGHMIPQDQPALALAVFTSFINSGGVSNGSLTSTTGSFISGILGSPSPTSSASAPAETTTAASPSPKSDAGALRRGTLASVLLMAGAFAFVLS